MRWMVCVMVLSGHAAADERAPVGDVSRSPFVTLDTLDGITRVGVDVSVLNFWLDNMSLRAYSLHGHVVEPRTGVGGYARLRAFQLVDDNYYHPDGAGSDQTESGRNNTTLGLLWASAPVRERFAFVTHLGFTIGNAADPNNSFSSTPMASTLLRPLDFYSALPRQTTADVGGSMLWRQGQAVGRVDAGLHLVAHCQDDGDPRICSEVGHGAHVNAAIGYMTRIGLTLGFEVSTIWIDIDDLPYGARFEPALDDLHFEHTSVDGLATGAMSARYRFRHVEAYVAGTISMRKYQQATVKNGVTIGIEGSL